MPSDPPSGRLALAERLDSAGKHEAAQGLRDYDAACNWFQTTATYAGREAHDIDKVLDEWESPCTLNWLMERAMVAIWKAAGSPKNEPQNTEVECPLCGGKFVSAK